MIYGHICNAWTVFKCIFILIPFLYESSNMYKNGPCWVRTNDISVYHGRVLTAERSTTELKDLCIFLGHKIQTHFSETGIEPVTYGKFIIYLYSPLLYH